MKLTATEIRSLPLPSPAQHREFVAHLKDAHSWYKHLPLIDGGIFVVFLNPHAGEGYPSQHPSLPYGNTIEGYHQAFGYLDYMYSIDGGSFDRDCGGLGKQDLELPPELLEQCSFTLYPYVSSEFYWCVHESDVFRLQSGTFHPERSHLLAWNAAAQALEYAEANEEVSKQIRRRIQDYNLFASLQIQEVIRIEYYLQKLYKWHSQEDNKALVDLLQNSPLSTEAIPPA
jgi:hypothetical protein